MAQIVFRQIDRVNLTASLNYDSGVLQKLNNLPMSSALWVEAQNDRYTEEKETFYYEAPCGTPIGTITDPCLKDPTKPVLRLLGEVDWSDPNIKAKKNIGDDEEPYWVPVLYDDSIPVKRFLGPIDWEDPNILSPKMVVETYVDYSRMDRVLMEANEYAGLTWQTELKLIDGGDTLEQVKKRKKTPFRIPRIKEEDEDAEEAKDN